MSATTIKEAKTITPTTHTKNKKTKKERRDKCTVLDSKLSMKKHVVIKICQLSSVRRFLTEDATKTLVTSYIYILSRLDYCNCLLMGTHNSVILHWRLISERIKYKVACICFSAINGSGPAYFSELLHVCTSSLTLRYPKGGRGYLMSSSCLESHGCHLIPLSYLFSCFVFLPSRLALSVLSFFC